VPRDCPSQREGGALREGEVTAMDCPMCSRCFCEPHHTHHQRHRGQRGAPRVVHARWASHLKGVVRATLQVHAEHAEWLLGALSTTLSLRSAHTVDRGGQALYALAHGLRLR
jgi:hypothetical protein